MNEVMYEEIVEAQDPINGHSSVEEKAEITADQILDHLKNGMSRKQINEKYKFNSAEKKLIWNHPALKGVKKGTPIRFNFVG